MARVLGVFVIVALAAGGCTSEVAPDGIVRSTESLTALGSVQGITVDGEGAIFVLAQNTLYERIDGSYTAIWTGARGEILEDVAALGEGRFALTTRNMGYELDLSTGALTQHFCYLPGEEIRIEDPPQTEQPTIELARSVTYDPTQGLIFAQPQTIAADGTGAVFFSEVASFDRVTGQELEFMNFDDAAFSAGGLAVLQDRTFLAGAGAGLWTFEFYAPRDKRMVVDLSSFDVVEIEGMAIDRDRGELLVLDGPSSRLLTLDLALVVDQM